VIGPLFRRVANSLALVGAMLGSLEAESVQGKGPPPEFVVIDLRQDGFCFTSRTGGVSVRAATGRVRTAWTCPLSDDGFLVVDHNKNGTIDGTNELIGGMLGPPNGFDYLRARVAGQFRSTAGITFVDSGHTVFRQLAVWTDRNHDGISGEEELQSLQFAGVERIDLPVEASSQRDAHGNVITARGAARLRTAVGLRTAALVSVRFQQ